MSKAIAEVFADAKHAPTSFEPEDWIGGFQFARAAIAERLADRLARMDASFDKAKFLEQCDVVGDEESEEA